MKLYVKYPKKLTKEPILSSLILETKTPINVLRAKMDGRTGEMIIDVEDEKVESVRKFLKRKGTEVKEISKGVTLDRDICIDCGACVSICPVNAFRIDNFSVELDESKCTLCKQCIDKCPVGALKIEFMF